MITVQLLGGASLRSGNTPLAGPPAQRHRIALLTMIVAAWPQPLSRDRAMALLWPERDLANARRLLNLAVHVLRAALGEGAIASAGDGLLLNPSCVSCDLHAIRAAIAAGAPDRIARLYSGPLLEGFHLDDSNEFMYWLDERRNELAHAYIGALLTIAERQKRSGDVHGRVGTCRKLVALDPHSAVYTQALMRALDAAGDRSAAIQHAAEHAQRLRTDLELDPDPGVASLAMQLARAPARPAPVLTPRAGIRSCVVAVLPFLNLSTNPENEYFADGITEDVIAHLSKIRAMEVIARASVAQFKQREQSIKEIAATLGATSVLDGSVRRAGDRVRIVATLIDSATDQHLWAETYDREMTDIFAIQTDVALHIAAALKAQLTSDEQTRVHRKPTRDLQAYHLFLQGRQRLSRWTLEAVGEAIECFERAIARDPSFALAYANLSMAHVDSAESGARPPDGAYARAEETVRVALKLDPELSAAHCTLGYIKTVRELDWAGAEQEFRRALELSPSNADALDLYGRLCSALGRHDEAIGMVERARELDPLAHRMDAATALLRAGRYDDALSLARDAVELDPVLDRAVATLGWAYMLSGRSTDGLAQLEHAVSLSPNNTMWLGQLGAAYGLAGKRAKAKTILRDMEARAKSAYVSPYHFAYAHMGVGDVDRALDFLEHAVRERGGATYGIKSSFLFIPLRAHPRFRALLRTLRLE
jgi:TolB-like protein/DNA-binding SARP family transcriptional activator/Flp pilus assembly protein TadD